MPERPNFTEDTVALAVEHYLSLLSFPLHRFSVELISRRKERWLGADARLIGNNIKSFKPFYMQFKRPLAYSHSSRSRIVSDRQRLGLEVYSRVLAFRLRQKGRNQREYQHNVLYRLRQRLRGLGLGDAAYVCPLFIDRRAYLLSMHWAGLRRWPYYWLRCWRGLPPWKISDIEISIAREVQGHNSLAPLITRIPGLDEHIVIPPHTQVQDANHSYSFSEDGTEICFHSPEALGEAGQRLSMWLAELSKGIVDPSPEVGYISAKSAGAVLWQVVSGFYGMEDFVVEEGDISSWFTWGSILEEKYSILQLAFVIWEQ